MTLTVGVNAVPEPGPTRRRSGGESAYLSPPTELRPLELVFDDVVGFTREWRLSPEHGPGMFCAQALVVSTSRQVTASVTVSAFEPADDDEVRTVAAAVARTLRLAAVPDGAG